MKNEKKIVCHSEMTSADYFILYSIYFNGRKCRGYIISRKSRFESSDFGTKSRGYQISREKGKVAGTKCREVVKVQKSRVLNVTNVANHTSIFLNFVPILTKIS